MLDPLFLILLPEKLSLDNLVCLLWTKVGLCIDCFLKFAFYSLGRDPVIHLLLHDWLVFDILQPLKVLQYLEVIFFGLNLVKEELLFDLALLSEIIQLILESLLGIRFCKLWVFMVVLPFKFEVVVVGVGTFRTKESGDALVIVKFAIPCLERIYP